MVMRHFITIIFFAIVYHSSNAQELDEYAEEDALFMSYLRFYQSITPFIKEPYKWDRWETSYDSLQKMDRVFRILNEYQNNTEYKYTKEEIDSVDIHPSELHILDYNGDGIEDLITQKFFGYRGHATHLYAGDGTNYRLDFGFQGMIVNCDQVETNSALKFIVYDYPCCDGYVHSLYTIEPKLINNTIRYRLTQMDKFVESNLKRIKQLPDSFNLKQNFTTTSDAVLFYRDYRPIYQKYQPYENYSSPIKKYHPFALLPENSNGNVLSETTIDTEEESKTLAFIKFEGILDRTNSIRFFTRKPFLRHNLLDYSYRIYYYGWIEKSAINISE